MNNVSIITENKVMNESIKLSDNQLNRSGSNESQKRNHKIFWIFFKFWKHKRMEIIKRLLIIIAIICIIIVP